METVNQIYDDNTSAWRRCKRIDRRSNAKLYARWNKNSNCNTKTMANLNIWQIYELRICPNENNEYWWTYEIISNTPTQITVKLIVWEHTWPYDITKIKKERFQIRKNGKWRVNRVCISHNEDTYFVVYPQRAGIPYCFNHRP